MNKKSVTHIWAMEPLQKHTRHPDLGDVASNVLNAEKTKMLIFRKGRGKKKENGWEWNRNITSHVKERAKRANIVVRQVWGIAERKFKDDFKRRSMMFDNLVKGVILYGAELSKISCELMETTFCQNASITGLYCVHYKHGLTRRTRQIKA
ncbi:hypothetical protein M0802_013670 [Mischocyttarus mexicanus]|nr:hypothetical protein M0802_013670 [Mischocyttarus mexicanus]